MKSRKKGIVIVVADIVCIVIWLFLDRNWESIPMGCLKIILLIAVFFSSIEAAACPYCRKVTIPLIPLRQIQVYCRKCGKHITYY